MLLFVVRPHGVTYTSPKQAIEILEAEPAACAEFLEVLEVAESRIEHLAKPMEGRLKNEVILTHARYTREEIVVGMRYAGFKPKPSPVSMQQGVFHNADMSTDVLLVTLKKNEKITLRPQCTEMLSFLPRSSTGSLSRQLLRTLARGSDMLPIES